MTKASAEEMQRWRDVMVTAHGERYEPLIWDALCWLNERQDSWGVDLNWGDVISNLVTEAKRSEAPSL